MTRDQFRNIVLGNKIVKIDFIGEDETMQVESLLFEDGHLVKINQSHLTLTHPEKEKEQNEFEIALENVSTGGLVSFSAKYLSTSAIERKIAEKGKQLNANGWGRINSHRPDQVTYRFDL